MTVVASAGSRASSPRRRSAQRSALAGSASVFALIALGAFFASTPAYAFRCEALTGADETGETAPGGPQTGNLACGTFAKADGANGAATAVGVGANALQSSTSAFGNGTVAAGDNSTAIGQGSAAGGGVNGGGFATFANPANTVVGQGSSAGSTGNGQSNNTVVGQGSNSNVNGGTILGQGSTVSGNGATALGQASSIASGADGGVALGQYSYANRGNAVSVGSDGSNGGTAFTRQIANVAAGTQGTDAVNLNQLNSAMGSVPFVADDSIGRPAPSASQDSVAGGYGAVAGGAFSTAVGNGAQATGFNSVAIGDNSVATQANTFSVADPSDTRRIVNVRNGTLSATSTDAVTGAQLYATNQNVAANANAIAGTATALGGGASYNPMNGTFTGPTYTFQSGQQFNNVGSALGNLDTRTTQNTQNINTLGTTTAAALGDGATYNPATGITGLSYRLNGSNQNYTTVVSGQQALASGAAGPVQYATPGTPSNALNLVGTGGPVTLGNLAAGTLTATSTQAVNGSQLFATNQQVATNSANITALQNGQAGPFRDNNTSGDPAPQASGANAVAGGFGSVASGAMATAIGQRAQATMAGATVVGYGAVASGDPTTAMGTMAMATGNEASAYGAFATASGDNSTALGRSATASGTNAVAVGAFSSATQANSVAIGTGVATTRANQIAIGSASQTYTMAGITSAQSLAAQTGTSRFITTDAGGNLATSNYGPNDIAALDGRVGNLEAAVGGLRRDVRSAFSGTAIALALSGAVLPPGKNYALSGGFGTYHGQQAFGASGVARITDNLYATGGVGFATSGSSNVGGRAGLTYAW